MVEPPPTTGVVLVIEFLCPNGHRIRCQAEQMGRAAKCPRCGVKFRVPDPADTGVSEAVGSDSSVLRPEFTDSGISGKRPPVVGGGEQKEPQIEFLCPNGHRLHGPASLQGKPGECPECASRFRIPTYEDISAEEEAEREIGLGRVSHEEGAMPTTISSRSVAGQAMAALFARLWDIRPKGTTVELRLRDGEAVAPHQFLKRLSQQSHQGVFAVQETDGSVSLVVVAWDAVARMTVRGLSELPKGLGE
jgi:hypothetical protein